MKFRNIRLTAVIVLLGMMLLPISPQAFAQAPACGEVYVVQSGDTLQEIAARCGLSVQTIRNLNPFIENSNLIYPGWILELRSQSAQVGIPQTGAGPRSSALYVVKAGDNLAYIARRLDISEDELLAANPSLEREEDLRTGQILRLSNTISSPAAAVSPVVVDPGQEVTVLAGGFPGNAALVFAGGPLGEQGVVLKQARAGSDGWLRTTLQIPDSAARGNRWAIVVHLANNPNVQALTNLLYVVNTSGPAEPILYTVRINDTLSSIAARFGVSIDAITNVNPQIENPRVIRVGQEILIPGALMRQQPVEGQAGVFLGPNSGPPGSEIEVFGTGFPPDSAINLRIAYSSEPEETLSATQVQASPRGTFFTTLVIPAGARQNDVLQVIAEPEDEEGILPPTAQFFVGETGIPQTGGESTQPAIALDPGSGPPGTIFNVTVSGYPANMPFEMGIGASQVDPNIIYEYRTDANGGFFARVQVPQNSPAGSFYIVSITPTQFTTSLPGLTARFDVSR